MNIRSSDLVTPPIWGRLEPGRPSVTTIEPDVRRLDVVDLGRGAVMALMALDHTRTFLTNVRYNPSDLTRTFPALLLTRWVSHFCTPMFLFLAGAGVFFMVGRRHPTLAAGRLVTRGFALIVLELTVVRWGWYFNLDYRHTSLQVLWAIGASMILLAPLIVLPSRAIGAIGLAVVALHNAVGPMVRDSPIGESWPWALQYERGRVLGVAPDVSVTVNFPVLPLFGIMAIGYASERSGAGGRPTDGGRAWLRGSHVGVLRHSADPHPMGTRCRGHRRPITSVQRSRSWPSRSIHCHCRWRLPHRASADLDGDGAPERPIWRALIIVGRVPMLFYLLHVPVIHAVAYLYRG